ncbi:HNH endonuclease [Paenibacillus sp. JSM ZJ436]|uniref:HNH endonuclease n=1 Tax=Paenibacillus sp. JSM ZJ436 TaxID=3376190 RepID=UPI0037A8D31E
MKLPKRIDLTGQQFDELEVICLSDQRNKYNTLLWECRCSCNKIIYVASSSLKAGHYKSCGCKKVEKRDQKVLEHVKRDSVDGTRLTALKAKLHKGNKSGHKGVTWVVARNKWQAYIGIKGKSINLGYFIHKEDAVNARKKAEELYHKPLLDKSNEPD